jgi:hypothetical protein
MARAPKKLTTKVKAARPKLSRSAVKSVNDLYYGSEPIDVSVKGYTNALNWYNYMHELDQARDWLLEYLKKNKTKDIVAAVRRVPKYRVPTTAGWIARMLMNGNTLQESSIRFLTEKVEELASIGMLIKEDTKEEVIDKPVVSIQERTQAKIQQLITECEEAIDTDSKLNIYQWLQGKEATAQAAAAIRDHYAKWIDDFEPDEFDTRAEKKHRTEQKKFWEEFVADCDRYCGNKKVTKVRKVREKKQKSAVELTSKVKYQKEFPPLKIVSVNPGEIIGAQQLWAYNTKYKKLTRYDAIGPAGLQVKGTSLLGFDVDKSLTKSVRKPEVVIQQLLTAGKVTLRKLMDELKTNETKPNGRINSDTVLLRVIK